MGRLAKILGIIVIIAVLGFIAFLGIHLYFSGGQLPLQPCTNCHGS